jgi:hypothetical protein
MCLLVARGSELSEPCLAHALVWGGLSSVHLDTLGFLRGLVSPVDAVTVDLISEQNSTHREHGGAHRNAHDYANA